MNEDLHHFKSLHSYLSILEAELDSRIKQTMVDVRKLQDIYEAIRPVEDKTPKINQKIAKLLDLAKGKNSPDIYEKPAPSDPYVEFQEALEAFNQIPGKKSKDISMKFANRILTFVSKTEAHVIHRLVPAARSLNREMDQILHYDLNQPSFALRASYATEKLEKVIEAFEKELSPFELNHAPCSFREKPEVIEQQKKKQHKISPTFDSFASLKIKELSSIFRKRGEARKSLIDRRIKEKIEEVFMPLIRSDDIDDMEKLKLASKFFPLLSNTRSYALVIEEPKIMANPELSTDSSSDPNILPAKEDLNGDSDNFEFQIDSSEDDYE